MTWWVVAAVLPWLRVAVQPTISVKAAGSWGITTIGVGLVGMILFMGAVRVLRQTGHVVAQETVELGAVAGLAFLLSSLALFGMAAAQVRA